MPHQDFLVIFYHYKRFSSAISRFSSATSRLLLVLEPMAFCCTEGQLSANLGKCSRSYWRGGSPNGAPDLHMSHVYFLFIVGWSDGGIVNFRLYCITRMSTSIFVLCVADKNTGIFDLFPCVCALHSEGNSMITCMQVPRCQLDVGLASCARRPASLVGATWWLSSRPPAMVVWRLASGADEMASLMILIAPLAVK